MKNEHKQTQGQVHTGTPTITMETALQPCCVRFVSTTRVDVYGRSVTLRKGERASIWRVASALVRLCPTGAVQGGGGAFAIAGIRRQDPAT